MSSNFRNERRRLTDEAERHSLHTSLDIGPAWLLLSHGAFLAAIVGGSNAAFAYLISNPAHVTDNARGLAIAQSAGSLVIGAWTIYAITGTLRENNKLREQVYGPSGFVALMLIVVFLMAIALWTLVAAATYTVGTA